MDRFSTFLVSGILFVAGCKDMGEGPVYNWKSTGFKANFATIQISDSTMLAIAYSSFFAPDTFYHEDLQGGAIYYESNLSIAPIQQRQPPYYFLATNSRQQALAWSESSAVNSAYYRELVGETETERYFEFRRAFKEHPTDVLLSRIDKLSYIDRSMYSYFERSPHIGRLNVRPIDQAVVRDFAEYFWFTEHYNLYGSKGLAAVTSAGPDSVYCAIYHLAISGGDWNMYDHVALIRTVIAVSRSTGDIFIQDSYVRSAQGRLN